MFIYLSTFVTYVLREEVHAPRGVSIPESHASHLAPEIVLLEIFVSSAGILLILTG